MYRSISNQESLDSFRIENPNIQIKFNINSSVKLYNDAVKRYKESGYHVIPELVNNINKNMGEILKPSQMFVIKNEQDDIPSIYYYCGEVYIPQPCVHSTITVNYNEPKKLVYEKIKSFEDFNKIIL